MMICHYYMGSSKHELIMNFNQILSQSSVTLQKFVQDLDLNNFEMAKTVIFITYII